MRPLALFLLACAGVYVGTIAAAFSALMRLSLRLTAERSGRDDRLARYLEEPLRLFIPVRMLLAMLPVIAAALLTPVTGESGEALALLVAGMLVFVVVFEHALPLLIIRRDPERVLDVLLPSFDLVARLLLPMTLALHRLSVSAAADRSGSSDGEAADGASESGAAAAAEDDAEDGTGQRAREDQDRELLRSIVDFRETLVREVMTPRPDIVAIRGDATLADLRALFREQEYSRIPVYADTLDNILGFVFVKDLITVDAPGPASVTALMRAAYFVPETKRVPALLREFQRERVQSAIVVDEYGGTAGLVTIEDLLEELVGEIQDEYDVETAEVVEEGDDVWVFSGKADVDELAERTGVEVTREGFETVGGYLLAHLGRVPAKGESFEIDGLAVEVLEAERRRITKVRIRRREAVAEDAPEPSR